MQEEQVTTDEVESFLENNENLTENNKDLTYHEFKIKQCGSSMLLYPSEWKDEEEYHTLHQKTER